MVPNCLTWPTGEGGTAPVMDEMSWTPSRRGGGMATLNFRGKRLEAAGLCGWPPWWLISFSSSLARCGKGVSLT
jgi:hypothetical protein